MTPGTFPCPNGVSTTFSNVATGTTPNFTLLDPGQYTITWEPMDPNNPPTVLLQQVVGSTTTTLKTYTSPGAFDYLNIPNGGMTLNWNVTPNSPSGGLDTATGKGAGGNRGAARLSVTLTGPALSLA